MINSSPDIQNNYIYQNKNNGIVCEQESNPKIIENFITRNESVGLALRH